MVVPHCLETGGAIVIAFVEILLLIMDKIQNLFLKFRAPHTGLDETCYLARPYLELLYMHSNKQMSGCVLGVRLLSLKNQKAKHKILNPTCPIIQGKRSQLFFTVL